MRGNGKGPALSRAGMAALPEYSPETVRKGRTVVKADGNKRGVAGAVWKAVCKETATRLGTGRKLVGGCDRIRSARSSFGKPAHTKKRLQTPGTVELFDSSDLQDQQEARY